MVTISVEVTLCVVIFLGLLILSSLFPVLLNVTLTTKQIARRMDNTAMIQIRDAELDLATWSATVWRSQEKTICISGIEVVFPRCKIRLS